MLEWNAFIKPLVYTIELIFALVVTIGTADKLLFYHPETESIKCALSNSLPACISVISLGSLCSLGGFYILWKRLSSAFLCDMKYRHDTESIMCTLLAFGWLCVSAVATSFRAAIDGNDTLRSERTVTITFSYLLFAFYIGSIAIAWFAPDEDGVEEHAPEFRVAVDASFAYNLRPGVAIAEGEVYPVSGASIGESEEGEMDASGASVEYVDEMTGTEFGDLAAFLEQHDALDDALPVRLNDTPLSMAGEIGSGASGNELRTKESIQDLASVWKNIVSQDIEAEKEELDISKSVQATPVVQEEDVSAGSVDRSEGGLQPRSAAVRRRNVRFLDKGNKTIDRRGHSG